MDTQTTTRRRIAVRRAATVLAVAALAIGAFVAPAGATMPDTADGVEVFERDVYEIVGSTLRNPSPTTDPSAPLFSNSGVGLGFTWGEWSAATATSVVRASGGRTARTDIRLAFTGLRPNGVYSVFYGTLTPDSENPLCPGVERTLALPSADPAQAPDASSFVAAADGTASFRGKLDGNLLGSASQVFFSVIYHFDGQTYGPLPNRGEFETQGETCRSSFGEDAMRHLLVLQQW